MRRSPEPRVLRFSSSRVAGPTEFWRTFRFIDRRQALRPQSRRPACSTRRGGRMDHRQRAAFHDHVFHIHTNDMLVTKVNGQTLAEPIWLRYGDRAAQRQHHVPLALRGLHRQVHAPLPHDEPRGAGDDAGRRGIRRRLMLRKMELSDAGEGCWHRRRVLLR